MDSNNTWNWLVRHIKNIEGKLDCIMANLAQLQAAVAKEDTVIDSALTLIQGLAQAIKDAGTDQAALDKLAADVSAKADSLAAAVAANTPAADSPPAP